MPTLPPEFVRDAPAGRVRSVGVTAWSKDEHLARFIASGHFRWCREIESMRVEEGDAERFVAVLLSQGDFQTLKKHGVDEAMVAVPEFEAEVRAALGEGTCPFWWSYRTRGRREVAAHSPVAPSIRSRNRSAWPLWREYSSIMWTRIHLKLSPSSPGRVSTSSSEWAAAIASAAAHSRSPRRERFFGVSAVNGEVAVPILVRVVDRRGVFAGDRAPEPVALDLGEVAHEAEQRHGRGRHAAHPQLLGSEPVALHPERRSVKREEGHQRLALRRGRGRVRALGRHGESLLTSLASSHDD